jgi:hypothetical protein
MAFENHRLFFVPAVLVSTRSENVLGGKTWRRGIEIKAKLEHPRLVLRE